MNELVEHGHVNPFHYTPGQICIFIDAIERREKRLARQRIWEKRIASLDHEQFHKAMKKLGY